MLIDREAPLRFLKTAFLPDDWIALLLKRHDTGEAIQRVGPLDMALSPRFQSWLRFKNAHRFCVFVSVNALTPGRRSRTRDSVRAVRHVFLDADRDAGHALGAIAARPDLPVPSYVVQSSRGRAHIMWRAEGFGIQHAEILQKQLARELGTDVAATSVAQLTRLPGFFNHKYSPSQRVQVHFSPASLTCENDDFPHVPAPTSPKGLDALRETGRRGSLPMIERARRYLAAVQPAIQGERGDELTFRICCTLVGRFGLTDEEALSVLSEWNGCCQPPWTDRDLADKVRRSRKYGCDA